jgi:ribosomal-protein-alanine N-acetyltransferase
VLGEKFWNHGYMSEALFKVIDFLFETTDVNRIEAEHDTKNSNSGKVMAKAGMTFEGVLREAGYNNQGIVDVAYYSILRSDRKA